MPSLVCHQLSFAWPTGEVVLDQLDATFPDGFTGLVGRNGCGKSTLLRLLAGRLAPTAGRVSGPERVGYLPQDLTLETDRNVAALLGVEPQLAALDRVESGVGDDADLDLLVGDWDLPDRLVVALEDLGLTGLDLHQPVTRLSGGETVLLGLAGQLLGRPDVLLLDEPTTNLDREARTRLLTAVRGWHGPVVVVSHDRDLLMAADQIAELRDGTLTLRGGNLAAWETAVAAEQEVAAREVRVARQHLRREQQELLDTQTTLARRRQYGQTAYESKREPRIVMRARQRSAQVSAAKLRQGHEADAARARREVDAAQARLREDPAMVIDLPDTRVPPGRDVLRLTDVVLRNGVRIDLHVRGPERLALVGPNGSGKTTLVETVVGRLRPAAGAVTLCVPARLLPQRADVLEDDESVLTAVAERAPSTDDRQRRSRLAGFGLRADAVARPVSSLSGGERFRATLAALLLAEPAPQLLVLDEPTNSLDRDSVVALCSALRSYQGALVVASHDDEFLATLDLTGRLDLAAGREVTVSRF